MTSMELWLTNLLGLAFLCSALFYLISLNF